ncbi:hypothetical protein BXO88_04000 [Oribacterium sp. C9]|nr:hypothetical protein BXO88_04000 [Oribacterium sp. C9]
MNIFDKNIILYGPPGTGKTYNSIIYAVAICDSESIEWLQKMPYEDIMDRYYTLRDDGRIEFTTFHQSYGYEEFIEGIKPKLNSSTNSIGYTIEDGIFKRFCEKAKKFSIQQDESAIIGKDPHIWCVTLESTGMTELKRKCFDNEEIRLGFTNVSEECSEEDTKESISKKSVNDFIYSVKIGDIVLIKKTLQSIDAIGVITGEYEYDPSDTKYPRKRKVIWLAHDTDINIVNYLPPDRKQMPIKAISNFDYFGVNNVSIILNKYTTSPKLEFRRDNRPYVFIIDEINRGNISKIFGELITLIEDTKREGTLEEMEAILPYSGEKFSVPNNVYIIGTMNTADRSIALMDTALRRRFSFAEMMPNPQVLESLGVGTIIVDEEELNVAKMLEIINKRIEYLFDREHTIGHAFFTKLADDASIDTLAEIFSKKVIPLLQEYFYEDYEKIQLVLGDNNKENEYKFILDNPVKVRDIFNGNPDIDLPEKSYEIQHEAFKKLQSYKLIGKDL